MKSILLFIGMLGFISMTTAADFEQQSLQLCEKVKSCALAELDGQDLSTEMKAMVTSSMDGMCEMMAVQFSDAGVSSELHSQASACMDSLKSLSCAELMEGESETPACVELEKRVTESE